MNTRQRIPFWVVFFLGLPLVGGCASRLPAVEDARETSAGGSLLEQGRHLAEQGQSLRAEQYLLAAKEAGAPIGEVLPLLLGTCIESGRFRSALSHVEARLLEVPDDEALRRLALALRQTLGLEEPQSASSESDGGPS